MRSLKRIGDECPPGRASRQTMFFCGPNSVGTLVAVEIPEPLGPRNLDQSGSARAPDVRPRRRTKTHAASERIRGV